MQESSRYLCLFKSNYLNIKEMSSIQTCAFYYWQANNVHTLIIPN